jgi:predicted Zn-dependent protease
MRKLYFLKTCARIVPLFFAASLVFTAQAPRPERVSDQETELGEAMYKELSEQAEIIDRSPLYDSLQPVTIAITRVAQSRYEHPFKFVLVHEAQPNAFSVPGGMVYVTDSLLHFVKNTEELAGTLCHEVSHTIHHDSMNRARQMQRLAALGVGAAVLFGPTLAEAIAISLLGDLKVKAYSRDQETAADVTGSEICAAAGYNPHGLVWLFQDFENADPQQVPTLMSDHPSNPARVRALEAHFRDHPEIFSRFSTDRRQATPFYVPEDAAVTFLRQ